MIMSWALSRTRYVHQVIFGKRYLLLTNTVISATMSAIGDSVVQNYELFSSKDDKESPGYNLKRTAHMATAGFTTGITTHTWYNVLERVVGGKRTAVNIISKILLDQIFFSPVNLLIYFSTLGICERSSLQKIRTEFIEKGLTDIYLTEWFIWPPMQLINFALTPRRYRMLFDNAVSFGFDIYTPYVKYDKK